MADPTIRERLRDILRSASEESHRRGYATAVLARDDLDALLDELDTLERRAIAATEDRQRFARLIVSYADLTHRVVQEGGDWHEISAEWSVVVAEARALITGDETRAALEASRGSA